MCGIIGIWAQSRVAEEIYESLINLQHRGQDAAGILTCQQRFDVVQDLGLVREIFNKDNLAAMKGNMGLGHTRYPTAGGYGLSDVQPLWIGNPRGIALVHNGNLVNYKELYEELSQKNHNFNSTTDSEVLLHLLSDQLENSALTNDHNTPFFERLCHAINTIYKQAKGSYSIVSAILGKGMVAFRDPHGIKPLVIGERMQPNGKKDYIFASETTMFYTLGFQSVGDVLPGELIYVDLEGQLVRKIIANKPFRPCVFEYVYFARPDSTLDGVSVYQSRIRMGQLLAKQWRTKYPGILPDVIISAPHTSNTAAIAFAQELGIRYCEGLYKNNFIGRTFMMTDQDKRSKNVRYKLTPQSSEMKDKKVLIVDDSIVRGTTSREIVKMIREHGASEVSFASACPPIIEPCFYGIDIPSRSQLLAPHKTEEDIRAFLDVDRLIYQQIDDLHQAIVGQSENQIETLCMACMNGQYITGHINQQKRLHLETERYAYKEEEA